MGTGDFTHPLWLKELQEKLEPAGNGLFTLRKGYKTDDVPASCKAEVFFVLSAEISCIYRKNDKTRKVHCVILVPDFSSAEKINSVLEGIGNIASDGRPILGLDARKLLSIVLESAPGALFFPAHAWTPHFSVFGAASGFDTMEECFEELTPHIHAIETGLSSDPGMNRRLSLLDGITLLSNSDAHSPAKTGREANIFDTEVAYDAMVKAIKTREGFFGTIEFFPEEGKYHHDGHRACGVSLTPKETISHNFLCPVCGKKVTVGVLHRVESLSDRPEGSAPDGLPPFYSVIPLPELIAETVKVGPNSKTVSREYFGLLESLGNEFRILLDLAPADIAKFASPALTEAIMKTRSGDVSLEPGFDGEYGRIRVFEKLKRKEPKGQRTLFI